MDRLGIGGQCLGIKPLNSGFRLTGRAFTILYGPSGMPAGTVGDYIDDVEPGRVVVLDNGGRENATVWGDILTMVAHTRKVAGTVIDGACRDMRSLWNWAIRSSAAVIPCARAKTVCRWRRWAGR